MTVPFKRLDGIIFGDGNQGNVVISASAFLQSELNYRNLTIKKGVIVNTNGFRIFVKEKLIIEGDANAVATIANDGQNSPQSVGSIQEVSSSVYNGAPGGAPSGSMLTGTLGGGGRGGAGP